MFRSIFFGMLLLGFCSVVIPAGDVRAQSLSAAEGEAMARFRSEVKETSAWLVQTRAATTSKEPDVVLPVMERVVDRVKAIKTDGLPTDLKSAWTDMTSALGGALGRTRKFLGAIKEMERNQTPETQQAVEALSKKLEAENGRIAEIELRLRKAGERYGLDFSTLLSKS